MWKMGELGGFQTPENGPLHQTLQNALQGVQKVGRVLVFGIN